MNRIFFHQQQNVRNAYCTPQSRPFVLEACFEILNIFEPKSFLELGFGNGDWSLLHSDCFSDKPNSNQVRYYGIDNFELCTREGSHEWYTWARNIEELRRRIETWKYWTGTDSSFYPSDGDILKDLPEILESYNTRYDCIRLDCLCSNVEDIHKVLSQTLEYAEDNFILLVDDCGLTHCPQRLRACIQLIEEKKIIPLWISDDEVGFVSPSFDVQKFISAFRQNHQGKLYKAEYDRYFDFVNGQTFPVLITKSF
jgi:hypothetical protein